MKNIVIIPARYGSSRFPGKPLASILNKPMIQWVYERASKSRSISKVFIATDDKRICSAVEEFGGKVIMTGMCNCGTDRIYQASLDIDCDIIINVQGDEPTIHPEQIDLIVRAFDDKEIQMVTLKQKIFSESELNDPNIVKVITDSYGNAIYFSRWPIPYDRQKKYTPDNYYKHIGIYGYRKKFLQTFVNLPISKMESMESLEQLRVIEYGYRIKVLETDHESIGVDLEEQIPLVEEILRKELNNQ